MRFALALALTACTATPSPCETCAREPARVDVRVCIDGAFAPGERDAANAACDAWTDALCGLVALRPRTVDSPVPVPIDCDVAVLRPAGDLAARFSPRHPGAVSLLAPHVAYVASGVTDARIFAHEIGHALGVAHGAGVMRARNPGACIDRRAAITVALGERP